MFAMLWMSVAAFSQITISQEDYEKLPLDTRTQIEQLTVKSKLTEVSKYTNLGKEIGIAVNETLKAVEDSAVRVSQTDLGKTAITIVVWKLLYKEIAGVVIGIILLGISIFAFVTGKNKLSIDSEDAGGITSMVGAVVLFAASMLCIFAQ